MDLHFVKSAEISGHLVPAVPSVPSVDEKLDKIIALLEQQGDSKADAIKKKIIDYMLKNYNISWIDDKTEEEMYEAMFSGLSVIIDHFL